MSIGRFRSVLTVLGLDPTPRELAEILWLASHLPSETTLPAPSDDTPQPEARVSNELANGGRDEPAPQASTHVPVHTTAGASSAGVADQVPARAIRLPAASPLTQPLQLLRALRPLKRRVPSRHISELDEEETAERTAQRFVVHGSRALTLAMRPATERWLDAVLVVDSHPTSRMLWASLTDDVHRILIQLGAFRDVRVRYLHLTPDGPLGINAVPDPSAGPLRGTSELCDPSGRRLVLVLTDGVAPGWNHPLVHEAVGQWAEVGPVAVLQALPEHLWPHTALSPVPARLRRPQRSAANADLGYTGYRRRTRTLPVGSVPIPVLELATQWFGPWARLVAGQGDRGIDTAVTLLGGETRSPAAAGNRSPQQRLQDFHATATPEAFRLMSCLSAVPLNVSVMRVVQAAMLPGSPPSVLAEVLFSGLIVPCDGNEATPLEDVPYDFLPEVRTELIAGLRSHEVDTILLEVTRFLERSAASAPGRVTGLIPDVQGQAGLPTDSIPWAQLRENVLLRAGFPRAVEPPERRSARPTAPSEASHRPTAGPYRLTKFVSRADFSEVFLGIDDGGNSAVVKVKPEDRFSSDVDMFRTLVETEAESLRRMDGRYAPRLLAADSQSAAPWLAMELVRSVSGQPAENLNHCPWAENSPPNDPFALLLLVQRLAEVLERAHSRGIVHGNLSPHAVLVVPDSVVVISWMYAQHDGRPHRYAQKRPTREEFLPPEGYSWTQPLHPSFDIYGLGAIVADEMTRYDGRYDSAPRRHNLPEPAIGRLIERCKALNPAHRPTAGELLEDVRLLLDRFSRGLSAQQARSVQGEQTEVAETREAYLPELAAALRNQSARLGEGELGRREESLEAITEAVDVYRRLAAARPEAYLPELAAALRNQSARLRELGRREDGLAAIEEAVTIRRELAAARPDTYLPELAAALRNQSARLGELGRREESLEAITEAVDVYRRLAAARPDTYLPDLASSLNNLSNRLAELGRREDGLAASEEAVTIRRELAAARPDTYLPDLASSLNNLSNRLAELGQHEDALAASEEAITAYRRLAAARPDTYLPGLAMSLNNLSNRLAELGRREDGLAASEEAVTIRRELAAARPDTYLPNLASSLNNLSNRLAELGQHEDALAASEEAITAYRRLAAARPDTYLPDLAMSLNNFSNRLAELGRREDGLAAIEEAVTIRRELAAARPDTYLPDLASSLNNFSNRLGGVGRHEDGLAAIEEAVTIRRELAAARPDTYLPDLAMSLNNLSILLGGLGQHEDALAASEEAVTAYRELAAARPDTYLPGLASTLNNLSNRLGELGRREDALAASEEAVTIRRELAAARPDTYLPGLAMSLNNLSNRLGELRQHEDGLAAIEEAVTIRRELAAARPDTYLPDLAGSLNNLSNQLGELGQHEDALAASEEAVTAYRELAAARPDNHLPDLAMSLNNLSNRLAELGQHEDALAAIEEAVTAYRELAAARPDAYLPGLAGSLNNLSNRLGGVGRHEDGLAAIEEAVTIRRELAAARPDTYLPDLASSLNNLSILLGGVGRHEDGLAAIEEAVTIRRELAAARPDTYQTDVEQSLRVLAWLQHGDR
ncbi:SAV_2336 N-terminal domain-related protein [Streptomyces sp. NPDC004096]